MPAWPRPRVLRRAPWWPRVPRCHRRRRDECAWLWSTSCSLRDRAPSRGAGPRPVPVDRTCKPELHSVSEQWSLQGDGGDHGAVVAARYGVGPHAHRRESVPDEDVVDLGEREAEDVVRAATWPGGVPAVVGELAHVAVAAVGEGAQRA